MKKNRAIHQLTKEEMNLTTQEISQMKLTPKYQKNYNDELKKAIKKTEAKIYLQRSIWIDLVWLIISAFATTIAFDYFISITGNSGLFPGGVGSIARLLAVIVISGEAKQGMYYYIFYLALNVPLIIFGLLKVGVKFTVGTLLFMLLTILFNNLINKIPVINPNDLSVLIDFQIISSLPNDWNYVIWLFVFATFGGIILGWAYATVYKVGFSTGGTDFVGMFFSKKKKINIASINRKVSIIILIIVVTTNSFTIAVDVISPEIKYSLLEKMGRENKFSLDQCGKILAWLRNDYNLNNFSWSQGFMSTTSSLTTNLDMQQWLLNQDNIHFRSELFRNIAISTGDNGIKTILTSSNIFLLRLKLLFGPSLFASFVLVLVQTMITLYIYPKYKVRTFVITTIKKQAIETYLIEAGYPNNFSSYEVEVKGGNQEPKVKYQISFSMSVFNWRTLENGILAIDQEISIQALKTSFVRGPFIFDLNDAKKEEMIKEKVLQAQKTMKKIEEASIQKTWKNNKESTKG